MWTIPVSFWQPHGMGYYPWAAITQSQFDPKFAWSSIHSILTSTLISSQYSCNHKLDPGHYMNQVGHKTVPETLASFIYLVRPYSPFPIITFSLAEV